MDEFEQAKEDLKEEIQDNEGVDIQDQMLKERRDWIQEYKALHANKPPEDLKAFYERFNTETPLSPEVISIFIIFKKGRRIEEIIRGRRVKE